jgi:hypothetical protein
VTARYSAAGSPVSDDEIEETGEVEEADDGVSEWPIKGPATARQALLAIAFVFFLGIAIGFLLARTF